MKTASVAMKAHLASDATTLAHLYKITRKDGTVFTFTDHDANLSTVGLEGVFSDGDPSTGGYVYEAASGISPTAIENKSDLSVDNQEVAAFIDSDNIKENDLRFGIWDSADVEIRIVNWNDMTMGEIKLRKGTLGSITMKNGQLTAEILGLTNKLQTLQGRSYGPQCDAELGDARCTVTVPVETASANTNPSIGTNDSHNITPYSGLTGAPGYYDDGILTITSGDSSGLSYQIKVWDGITLTLTQPLFVALVDGDTFNISPGCDKSITTCKAKFNNVINFRGFPKMPGQDAILQYPDSTG